MSADQIRGLHGGTRNHAIPLRNDLRPWVRWPATIWEALAYETLARTLLRYHINVLLVFTPVAIAAGVLHWNPTTVFILNSLAIIPFAALLNFAIDELSLHLGRFGGLINGMFGRPVDLIIGIIALVKGEVRLVQSSMLGSILFNILLVLGSSFVVGGIRFSEQSFNSTATSTMSSLMTLASACLVLPTTFAACVSQSNENYVSNILILSHGTAQILLILYLVYQLFQLHTHREHFEGFEVVHIDASGERSGEDRELQTLGLVTASLAIILQSIIVAVCTSFLIDSIDSMVETFHMSKNFFGIMLIPITGNVAEYSTTCMAAWRNNTDLVLSLAIGNSMQIALFVTPFLVTLGWIIGQPMTFNFTDFEAMTLFVSVFVVVYLIRDGRSTYLEGIMCLGLYIIIALAVCMLPDDDGSVIRMLIAYLSQDHDRAGTLDDAP